MSRYCYANDPGGNMQSLIASCVNGYSQPIPGNPGRSLDCLSANMSCADPPPGSCPPCVGIADTVYIEVPSGGGARPSCPECASLEDMGAFLYAMLAVFMLGSFFAGVSFGGK